MGSYISDILQQFDFPQEARPVVMETYDKICSDPSFFERFQSIVGEYEKTCLCDYAKLFADTEKLAEDMGIHKETVFLVLFLVMTKQARVYHQQNGLPDESWKKGVEDIKYKTVEGILVRGRVGVISNWYIRFFKCTRTSFGNLQFETLEYPFSQPYQGQGVYLTPEDQVLRVHIPRTGGPLVGIEEAYRQAYEFYKPVFGDKPVVFYCGSWLLYPKTLELLKPTSNIRRFAADYDIVEVRDDPDYSSAWRLFDKEYTGDPDLLPADSSLRRGYIEIIRRGEKIGIARGIYVYRP